jgi:hypothetical protein
MTYVRQDKLALIDVALSRGMVSFADLGGSWGVEGYYTRYTLDQGEIEKAYIVDLFYPPNVEALVEERRELTFIHGDFAKRATLAGIEVDTIYLFDVLLHQYNWPEVLRIASERAARLVIYNPQWNGRKSVRLTDMKPEDYYKVTPHYEGDPLCANVFNAPGAVTRTGRSGKDDLAPFQWGITDADLEKVMEKFGCAMVHYQNSGQWLTYPDFDGCGFIFER